MPRVVMRLWSLDPASGYEAPLTRRAKHDAIAKQVHDIAHGAEPPLGPYLKSYDPDGNFGAGKWEFTDDKAQARVFADVGAATECWRAVSKRAPRRMDGKPNRPLTQFNVTFEDV